ncbi:hypothetical protein [Moorena producens]|uniref:hypothetical protein n=1 Tax=Moorena producens TaxID=1155739 RepID=UPI003C73C274
MRESVSLDYTERVHLNACCLTRWCVTGRAVPTRREEFEHEGKPAPNAPYALTSLVQELEEAIANLFQCPT